jgi:hypothetical protein
LVAATKLSFAKNSYSKVVATCTTHTNEGHH